MRVVIDTNVVVSAAYGGKPREVVALWKRGEITLCLSEPIADEYARVLERCGKSAALADFRRYFNIGRYCIFCDAPPPLKISADSDDDKFLECAFALSAEFVVSGDSDLLATANHPQVARAKIAVVTPADFLAQRRK